MPCSSPVARSHTATVFIMVQGNKFPPPEEAMKNYLPAIDIMMCHLGISFEQACEQLGLSQQEQQALDQLQQQQSQAN